MLENWWLKPTENSEALTLKLSPKQYNLYREWEEDYDVSLIKFRSKAEDPSKKGRDWFEEKLILMLSSGQFEDEFLYKDLRKS